jgi:hypothetical protein
MGVIAFISSKKIGSEKKRQGLINIYKGVYWLSIVFDGLSASIIMYWMGKVLYNVVKEISLIFTGNIELSSYLSLTLILVFFEPIILVLLKSFKKKMYVDNMENEKFQGTGVDGINNIL